MSGLENLIQNGHLDPRNPSTLKFKRFGSYGYLNLGGTTLKTLSSYLRDIDPSKAEAFTPTRWRRPKDIGDARPDALITRASSVVAVVENKSPGAITRKKDREGALEQLYTYVLATGSKVGIVTDGNVTYWLHDFDPKRRHQIKEVKTFYGTYSETPTPDNLKFVISHLDPRTDQVTTPAAANPSHVARSVWQSVYIATRQSPEKCFQTFVELFMYKLLSDYNLLPGNQKIDALVTDSRKFFSQYGFSQVEFYVDQIRDRVKKTVFPRLNTQRTLSGIQASREDYIPTARLIPSIDTNGGETSIIDGHAFEVNPQAYNEPFVTALRRLNQIESVVSLDKTFKSRVYEQFLRRDPNATKVTGKYFTPRNIVKAIVQMANVAALPPNAVVCDPACGVGGFITESLLALEEKGVKTYKELPDGEIKVHAKFVGLEHDESIVCLAKSNFLLHTIETFLKLSETGRKNYSKLLADVFVYCHEDPTLGTLAHPVSGKFDLIMANPPYVVSGTKDVTQKINRRKELALFYDGGGSGLESRFVNWIVNALRPGGRAFIILPKSMLARTESSLKEFILKKCNLDALIYLPPQCFYTAPLETYILALTKKYDTLFQQQEPVFAYFVREIGETRDTRREPTDSDLPDMVKQFRSFMADRDSFQPNSSIAKVVPVNLLSSKSRWDVDYLWTTKEREELGVVDFNVRSCEAIIESLVEVKHTLEETKSLLDQTTTSVSTWRTVNLSDATLFTIHRGKRVTDKNCKEHLGSVVVIASGRHKDSYFGLLDEEWLKRSFDPEGTNENLIFTPERRILTVGSTGSVGRVHIRDEEKWFLHDDALAVELLPDNLDKLFCRYALQAAIDESHFDYSAKLYRERLTSIKFRVPVDENGDFDYEKQKEIASILSTKENTEMMLRRLSESLRGTEISVPQLT